MVMAKLMYNFLSDSILIWISVRHSDCWINNAHTKLAFNSLKMIQNDSLSANQAGDDRPLTWCVSTLYRWRQLEKQWTDDAVMDVPSTRVQDSRLSAITCILWNNNTVKLNKSVLCWTFVLPAVQVHSHFTYKVLLYVLREEARLQATFFILDHSFLKFSQNISTVMK